MTSVMIELTQAQLDSIAAQQAGGGGGVGAPADVEIYPHGAQQPLTVQPNGGIYVAELAFNGERFETDGLPGQPWCYFKMTIGAGYHEYDGLISQISYSEHAEFGGMQYTKKATFSKTPGDFSTNLRLGASGNWLISINSDYPNAIRINDGEEWYLNFKNERENGQPSASASDDGDFQVTPGAPAVGA